MKTKDKNLFLKPIFENIPEELKSWNQWVCWKEEMVGDKLNKVPYDPVTGKWAKSNDSKSWSDFKTAVNTYGNGGKFDGVGFVLTSNDPYVGCDRQL
jgi:primase-polymerase (primpol)-like protein